MSIPGSVHRSVLLFSGVTASEFETDATWMYHLRQGDYSRWLREAIKDENLADEVARIEEQADISASQSRALIKAAIEKYYTFPPRS